MTQLSKADKICLRGILSRLKGFKKRTESEHIIVGYIDYWISNLEMALEIERD